MSRWLFSILANLSLHSKILRLAIPMVISNISVPLLGIVDAAIIGHLDKSWYLGGVALGGTMMSVSLWLMGFLRMSTTGLAAQAQGQQNKALLARIFVQGIMIALLLAVIFLCLSTFLVKLVFYISQASAEVEFYAQQYFLIRIFGAPAALINLVILGWLLGMHHAKAPMWIIIIINLSNIVLDVFFVMGLDAKVAGAAWASVLSDYIGLMIGIYAVYRAWIIYQLPKGLKIIGQIYEGFLKVLSLNRDIFLRSLCLQLVFSFMAFKAASLSDDIIAANAILMGFFMLISYGLDGVAYSMEATVGKAIGARNMKDLIESLVGSAFWGFMFSGFFALFFWLFGAFIIGYMTDITSVQHAALLYLPWLIIMPLVAVFCFLLDGIFIGAAKGKEMRNTMLIAMLSYFIVYVLFKDWENHGLWFAMLIFMMMRGLTLSFSFYKILINNVFMV